MMIMMTVMINYDDNDDHDDNDAHDDNDDHDDNDGDDFNDNVWMIFIRLFTMTKHMHDNDIIMMIMMMNVLWQRLRLSCLLHTTDSRAITAITPSWCCCC